MTKVKMLYHNNLICGFEMEGHACYNPGGPDVICASLSAASQMTVNGVLDATGYDYDELVREANAKDGILKVELDYYDIFYDAMVLVTQQLFKAFELYIVMLSEQFPDNVQIERRGE